MSLLSKVKVIKGDITTLKVDAICNTTNKRMLAGGSGVNEAVHRAAGKELQAECSTLNGCTTGEAKITKGYNLPARYVIHTVGPPFVSETLLASCYSTSLNLIKSKGLRSIAFPCISTGLDGDFPNKKAASVAFRVVMSWLNEHSDHVDEIIFCTYLPHDYQFYNDLIRDYSEAS